MKRISLLRCLLIALVVIGVFGLVLYVRAQPDTPIAATGGVSDLDGTISGITAWRQDDPTWGREPLGGSGESMAAVGCTITSTAMALKSLGHSFTPLDVCRGLKAQAGFTPQGHLIWSAQGKLTDGAVRVEFPALTHANIDNTLRQKNPVITKIMLGGDIPHWVLIVGKQGAEYLAFDPLNPSNAVVRVSTLSPTIHAIRVLARD